jgi:transposase
VPNKEVAEIVGISAQTISTYYTQYKNSGANVFKVKSAGRPKKSAISSREKIEQIAEELMEKLPGKYNYRIIGFTIILMKRSNRN